MSLKDLSATLKLPSQMGLFPFMICDITSNPPWWFSNLNTAEMRHSSLKHGEKKKMCEWAAQTGPSAPLWHFTWCHLHYDACNDEECK